MLAASVSATAQKDKFSIEGSVKNFAEPLQKVYLVYSAGGQRITDSSEVKDGKYAFKGSLVEPVKARLQAKYVAAADGKPRTISQRRDVASVFIEPAAIKITSNDSFSNIVVKGSASNAAAEKLDKKLKPLNEEMNAFMAKYSAADAEGKKKLDSEYDVIDNKMKEVYKQFATGTPASPIALYAITQYAGYDINAAAVQPLFNKLPAKTRALPSATEFAERLAIAHKLVIGNPAMEFTQMDTAGKPVSLASLRGKVLLVDFWASWCGPCRRDNPNVVRMFNQYKDKGFDVLGVSLDRPDAKEKWLKAIHDDKLTWTHVSDLKYWDNDVAKLYGVRAIPFNLLLDKEGKIIGRNLHGDELDKKLGEVFAN